jgi:ABC-2 type transport system permease protein
MNLIRSELMKIRTTNTWWLFGIGIFVFTAISLLLWIVQGNFEIDNALRAASEPFVPPEGDLPPAQAEMLRQQQEYSSDIDRVLRATAAQIYTSGQYFGVMFVMLLGAILFTNEFYHQMATATFLTTPQRVKVIFGKFATAGIVAVVFWLFTTAINLAAGSIFFSIKGYSTQLDQWPVTRSILMNGLAFVLWGILGVGLGVLIRNQIGAVVTGAIAYIIGSQAVTFVFQLIYFLWIQKDWVMKAAVVWPSVATQVMVSPEQTLVPIAHWWIGALVLVGYGLVFGLIGTLITRRRDIS